MLASVTSVRPKRRTFLGKFTLRRIKGFLRGGLGGPFLFNAYLLSSWVNRTLLGYS